MQREQDFYRALVSDAAARALLPDAPEEPPYPGAKPLLVAQPDDPELLAALAERMTSELEVPRKKKVGR